MTEATKTPAVGRELDALVAERVMGWKRTRTWLLSAEWNEATITPPFSTDIESAWRVVDKMKALHYFFQFEAPSKSAHDSSANFSLIPENPDRMTCDSAPMSICYAALEALGVLS